jgi:hypothetical protein
MTEIDAEVRDALAESERRQQQHAQAAESSARALVKALNLAYTRADLVHLRSAEHEIRTFEC